ncbi:hypothetical protein HYY75_03475, partial [bacterium]|nr:hypothetical protein [bacterium]
MKIRWLALSAVAFSVFSILVFARPSQAPSDLANLLSGKSTDIQAVLSSIEEKDIPLALAVVESLKFKALHGESKLTLDAIEQFKNAVEKRLKDAKSVFIPTAGGSRTAPTNWVHVPSREITIEGIRLT